MRNFSFETLFSNANLNEDTEHFLGHQKCSVLVCLKYHNLLAVCLGFFLQYFFSPGNFLGWQPVLSTVHMTSMNSSSVTVCLLLVKMGPIPFPRRCFCFPLPPRESKDSYSYTALSFTRLKSIRYSSGYFFLNVP